VLWLLVGAALTVVLVADPFGFSPVDEWLGVEPMTAEPGDGDGHKDGLWTCGMHPEVVQDEPGTCPICKMELTPARDSADPVAEHGAVHGDILWTCPMHPTVVESEPGTCPICGMDLVPADTGTERAGGDPSGRVVTVSPAVQQRMNVRVEPVVRRDLAHTIRTVGSLGYDQERMVSVTTRYQGFVERVLVDAVGERVRKDQPLFEVYAPQLVQTQQELLAALRYARGLEGAPDEVRARAEQLVEAARARLGYWDVTPEEVAAIEAGGTVRRTLTVVSPLDGVVMQRLHGLEGMAVSPGMDVIHVADLSSLWLSAEVYEDQLAWLGEGVTASVSFDYLPGETRRARVRFIEPEVSPTTRTVKLVLTVPNPDGRLRVGMFATVQFEPVAARDALVVPAQALIRTGTRDLVVVALGEGRFEPREVVLGVEADGVIQVLEGLDGSERVVTSAQFLIDSESNLRAAIDAMRSGHGHGGGS
jgi:Cu(I)/Ag(I) efflux system membrane fusion protein/cobalt-zinc-cadmium efflux system membrane fusion protein